MGLGAVHRHVEHQIFHLIMADQPADILLSVPHILGIQSQIIKFRVEHGVQSLGVPGPGGGSADHIRIKFLMVLLQIGKFGHLDVACLIIGPPAQQPVSKYTEGVCNQVKQHPASQRRRSQDHQHNGGQFQAAGPGLVSFCLHGHSPSRRLTKR